MYRDEPLAGPMSREAYEESHPPEEPTHLHVPAPTKRDVMMRMVGVLNIANQLTYDPEADQKRFQDGLWTIGEFVREALDILNALDLGRLPPPSDQGGDGGTAGPQPPSAETDSTLADV